MKERSGGRRALLASPGGMSTKRAGPVGRSPAASAILKSPDRFGLHHQGRPLPSREASGRDQALRTR